MDVSSHTITSEEQDEIAFEINGVVFNRDAAVDFFQRLSHIYYDRNFGTAQKAEIDLEMFKFYLETLLDSENIKRSVKTDYEIGRKLGITPSRVSNLRSKIAIREQDGNSSVNCIELLKKMLDNNEVVRDKNFILILFNTLDEKYAVISDFESRRIFFDYSFNPKVVKIPVSKFQQYLVDNAFDLQSDAEKCESSSLKERDRRAKEWFCKKIQEVDADIKEDELREAFESIPGSIVEGISACLFGFASATVPLPARPLVDVLGKKANEVLPILLKKLIPDNMSGLANLSRGLQRKEGKTTCDA